MFHICTANRILTACIPNTLLNLSYLKLLYLALKWGVLGVPPSVVMGQLVRRILWGLVIDVGIYNAVGTIFVHLSLENAN